MTSTSQQNNPQLKSEDKTSLRHALKKMAPYPRIGDIFISALWRFGYDETTIFCLKELTTVPEIRTGVLNAIERLMPSSDELRLGLGEHYLSGRRAAFSSLSDRTKDLEVRKVFIRALHDVDEKTRSIAASSLTGAKEDSELRAALLNILNNRKEAASLRSTAALSLSEANENKEVLLDLINLLDDKNEEVRNSVILSLRKGTKRSALRVVLIDLIKTSKDANVRRAATWQLRTEIRHLEVRIFLIALFEKDRDTTVRRAAAQSLSKATEFPKVRTAFIKAIRTDEDSFIRSGIACSLEQATKHLDVRTALIEILEDEDLCTRRAATWSLEKALRYPDVRIAFEET